MVRIAVSTVRKRFASSIATARAPGTLALVLFLSQALVREIGNASAYDGTAERSCGSDYRGGYLNAHLNCHSPPPPRAYEHQRFISALAALQSLE